MIHPACHYFSNDIQTIRDVELWKLLDYESIVLWTYHHLFLKQISEVESLRPWNKSKCIHGFWFLSSLRHKVFLWNRKAKVINKDEHLKRNISGETDMSTAEQERTFRLYYLWTIECSIDIFKAHIFIVLRMWWFIVLFEPFIFQNLGDCYPLQKKGENKRKLIIFSYSNANKATKEGSFRYRRILRSAWQALTVWGLGLRMRLIRFLAPVENHGGQETLAREICKENGNSLVTTNFTWQATYVYCSNLPIYKESLSWGHRRANIQP